MAHDTDIQSRLREYYVFLAERKRSADQDVADWRDDVQYAPNDAALGAAAAELADSAGAAFQFGLMLREFARLFPDVAGGEG